MAATIDKTVEQQLQEELAEEPPPPRKPIPGKKLQRKLARRRRQVQQGRAKEAQRRQAVHMRRLAAARQQQPEPEGTPLTIAPGYVTPKRMLRTLVPPKPPEPEAPGPTSGEERGPAEQPSDEPAAKVFELDARGKSFLTGREVSGDELIYAGRKYLVVHGEDEAAKPEVFVIRGRDRVRPVRDAQLAARVLERGMPA